MKLKIGMVKNKDSCQLSCAKMGSEWLLITSVMVSEVVFMY